MTTKQLLLVEDDELIARTLRLGLHYRGFEVTPCFTAEEGLRRFGQQTFDIAILDVNLPDADGYSLCRKLRAAQPELPIVMLTARVDEESAVKGIDSGADDYVRKPFGLEELTARLNRLLGRRPAIEEVLNFKSLRLSFKQRMVWVGEKPVTLFKREFEILALLLKKPGEVVSREQILNALDPDNSLYDRTVDSHLSHLRRKLKEAGLLDVQISPVYGVGYRLDGK